jgi:hypothetical protein
MTSDKDRTPVVRGPLTGHEAFFVAAVIEQAYHSRAPSRSKPGLGLCSAAMGEVLADGRYTVVRRLAQGGMGEVLLAEFRGDSAIGISKGLLVVKRVLGEVSHRGQATMLREEGRVALRLLHDNLVETFFVDEHEGNPLVVMEFLSGRALSQVLRQAKGADEHVPVEVALAVLRASACGLHFAHTLTDASTKRPLGLIHRDISPANLFVTFDGRAKVIDFGVAKADDSEIRTSTGVLKGKLNYMSPEHARGEELTPATDLWSLGVCFWETLCAERLFPSKLDGMLEAISETAIPSPQTHRPELEPRIVELCMHLLERRVEHRFGSGADVVNAIDALPEAKLLHTTDLGGWLAGRFPEEAAAGKSEAARCAHMRRQTPVPIGLVEGTATDGVPPVPGEREAPTLSLRLRGARPASTPLGAGAREDELDKTISVGDDRTKRIDGDATMALAGGRSASSMRRRSASWVAVASVTFGALAVAMGVAFSFLAPRKNVHTVAAFEDVSATFDIVVAPRDAPPPARLIDVEHAQLKSAGRVRDVPADELKHKLLSSGVGVRASLPQSAGGTLAILLPLLMIGMGLLALALAAPALTVAATRTRLMAQAVLVLACAGALAAMLERGALSWPGMHAWRSTPRLEMK